MRRLAIGAQIDNLPHKGSRHYAEYVVYALLLLLAAPEARQLFEDAEKALRANDLVKAERGFRAFLKEEPEHLGALGNLGVVYSRMGRYSDAVSMYRQALKLAPNSPDLHLNLGLAWLKQDDHKNARASFEVADALRRDHAQTRELLATTLLFTGDAGKAVKILEALPASQGVQYLLAIGYLKENQRSKAQQTIQRLFSTLKPAQAHYLAGRAYYESTLFEEALAELTKARERDANLPAISREIGKTQVSLRRPAEAKAAFREALIREPGDAESLYFLGALLVQEGDIKAGRPLLERARAARPSFWGVWYYLGKAALTSGELRVAAPFLRRAAELNPEEPSVQYQLSRACKAAGLDAEAKAAMQRYTELRAKSQSQAEEALVAR